MTDTSAEFDAIYATYRDVVLAGATRLVGSTDAEDVAQAVWLKVFTHFEDFRGDAKVSTWLFVVVRNAAYDHLRARGRHGWPDALALDAAYGVPVDAPDAEAQVLVDERRAFLHQGIAAINPIYQSALLWWLMDRPARDAVEVFGVPYETVKSRKHRAVLELTAWVSRQQECRQLAVRAS